MEKKVMKPTPEQFNLIAGELPDMELTIPLGMDRKPIPQPPKKYHPKTTEMRKYQRRKNGIYILGAVIYLAATLICGALLI